MNGTDHDLLIGLHENVKSLCKKTDTHATQNREDHADIIKTVDKMNTKVDRKLDIKVFLIVISMIVTSIIGLATYTTSIDTKVEKNGVKIEVLQEK